MEVEDGTLHVGVPHRGHVRDTGAGVTLPPAMEVSDVAFFQPIGDRRAIVNGDIVMTADEIQAVIRALRENDIQAFALDNHMLYERPRLFYMHYWATGMEPVSPGGSSRLSQQRTELSLTGPAADPTHRCDERSA